MTKGIIQQAAKSKDVADKRLTPGAFMQKTITGAMRDQFVSVLKDKADGFIASVIDLYASDKTLQECAPGQVCLEALKAATLDLPINKQLGFAYIVPYRNKQGVQIPQFQIGYKGLIQLAQRTGSYRYINMGVVYEGMDIKTDTLTGEVKISGEAESETPIGYFAYIETLNGFSKALYWSVEKVSNHAKKRSKSYGIKSSPWTTDFDAMACKTVLRNLISRWGVMSVEMLNALEADDVKPDEEAAIEKQYVIQAEYTMSNDDLADDEQTKVDSETGEIMESEADITQIDIADNAADEQQMPWE